MFFDVLGPMTQTQLFAMKKHCFAVGHCKLESRIVNSRPTLGAFLPPWGCRFSTFTCFAQALACRCSYLYSGFWHLGGVPFLPFGPLGAPLAVLGRLPAASRSLHRLGLAAVFIITRVMRPGIPIGISLGLTSIMRPGIS